MQSNREEELQQIRKKLIIMNMIDAHAAVLCGLGIYGLYGASGDAFIDILNNQAIATTAAVAGGMIMFCCMAIMFPLFKRKADLMRETD